MANSATSAVKSQIPGAHKAMLARMKRREFDKMRKLNKTRAKVQSSVQKSFGEEVTRDDVIDALVEGWRKNYRTKKIARLERKGEIHDRKGDVARSKGDVARSKADVIRARLGKRIPDDS